MHVILWQAPAAVNSLCMAPPRATCPLSTPFFPNAHRISQNTHSRIAPLTDLYISVGRSKEYGMLALRLHEVEHMLTHCSRFHMLCVATKALHQDVPLPFRMALSVLAPVSLRARQTRRPNLSRERRQLESTSATLRSTSVRPSTTCSP
jgi:hypothetical protein